jgi:hypothetical protein
MPTFVSLSLPEHRLYARLFRPDKVGTYGPEPPGLIPAMDASNRAHVLASSAPTRCKVQQ